MNGNRYDRPGEGLFYSPFNLALDPMERLLLINFGGDPDEIYNGFEPQVFADSKRGRGLIVIAYLPDTRFDIYHQPGLRLNRADYEIVGKGLRELVERPMTGARFEVTQHGLDLDIQFDDFAGRSVDLRIKENGQKPTKPFTILAPLGNTTENPPAMPVYFLYDFYFVRRHQTEVLIAVDGRKHKPDSIPMILDGARVHFLRYAADPFLAHWNEAHDGPLSPIEFDDQSAIADRLVVSDGAMDYELILVDGHPEIVAMSLANERHVLRINFDPPLPDVIGLRDGAIASGGFSITGRADAGSVGGVYRVSRTGQFVDIKIHPRDGWRPNVDRWSVKFIFAVAPVFKKWPTTYEWHGRIELNGDQLPVLRSSWKRLKEESQGRVIRLFK